MEIDPLTTPDVPISPQQALVRYPNVIAHLICHSLGYFTPLAAAQAVADYRNDEENWSEWYIHMASADRSFLQVGRETIQQAIRSRRHHQGFMAHYPAARAAVQAEIDRTLSITLMTW